MDGQLDAGQALVTCRDVTREYVRGGDGFLSRWRRSEERPRVRALDGVSMNVNSGEIVGIEGPSGSGKSTLLHLLAGLDTPTSGTVELAGVDIASRSERGRAKLRLDTVGLVFQHFYLLPSLSARSNVAVPLVELGVRKRERRARAVDLLEQVGLGDRTTHLPGELSGGEQQRVAIARALATDPDLIVADEPTGELDTETGEAILDVFEDLAADGHGIVLASHDRPTLERATRRVVLKDGRRVDA